MEDKYNFYDNVISTIMTNILVERQRCGKILLYDYDPSNAADRLYFNVATIAADLNKENIYINTPLLDYRKIRKKFGKKRSNLRWFGPLEKKKLSDDHKTSVYIIMDFIGEQLNISDKVFQDINREYYEQENK